MKKRHRTTAPRPSPKKAPKAPRKAAPTAPSLSQLIAATGLSHGAFARSISVDPSYISHILTGRKVPSLRRANLMADQLGVGLAVVSGAISVAQKGR